MTAATRIDGCSRCGRLFEQLRKRGRPRRYCDACSGGAAATAEPAFVIKPDPPARPDGRCVVCLRPRVVTSAARKYAGAQLDLDPFCSTRCCRRWHGCELAYETTRDYSRAA